MTFADLLVAVIGGAIFGISTYWSIMTLEYVDRWDETLSYRLLYQARYGLAVLVLGGSVYGSITILSASGAMHSTILGLIGELSGIGGVLVFNHELYRASKQLYGHGEGGSSL